MYHANYIAKSNQIVTKHKVLKDKSKSKGCIPDLRKIHSMECMDTLAHLT